jgi:hypothetical protein
MGNMLVGHPDIIRAIARQAEPAPSLDGRR